MTKIDIRAYITPPKVDQRGKHMKGRKGIETRKGGPNAGIAPKASRNTRLPS
jgi:hypothetical protein